MRYNAAINVDVVVEESNYQESFETLETIRRAVHSTISSFSTVRELEVNLDEKGPIPKPRFCDTLGCYEQALDTMVQVSPGTNYRLCKGCADRVREEMGRG